MKESEILELKKSTAELKEAIISLVSILNKHKKGEIYFGIKNDGEIVGQEISERTIREISKAISNNIEPKIFPKISEIILEGKKCVHVDFSGNDAPYYAYGRAYIRVGDENKKISVQELESLILRKNKDKLHWDNEVCAKAKIDDIDEEKIKLFLKKAGLEYNSVENSLEKLGLIKEGRLLNTAVFLFGKHPENFFPNAKLRCAVFGTTDTSITIDMHDYEGDVFSLIDKAEEYTLAHINIGMKLDGLRRIDVPEIDKDAFREAIINAFCHRDYYEYDSVNIAVFKDRVEIRSPGELYGGLTIEEIKNKMVSRRRNELIASMFHEVHFVERWGRGISLILSKEPDADFEVVAGIFITRFKRKGVEKGVKKFGEGSEKSSEKIIDLIKKNKLISAREMATIIGISQRAIEKQLAILRKKSILKRVGSDKGGYWEIIRGQN